MGPSLLLALLMQVAPMPALQQVNTELPEYGLIEGPDGFYVTRATGPWGKSKREEIWIYRPGENEPQRPIWAAPDKSESDFYYDPVSATGYFISDRSGNADIWRVEWSDGEWLQPEHLPEPVNSAGAEYSPVIRKDGELCFASMRDGGKGQGDLYCATPVGETGWRINALDELNTPDGEWNLGFSPNGATIIFEASGRSSNKSNSGDLYISRQVEGAWSSPVPLSRLNTDGSELMARYMGDGVLAYASSSGGDADIKTASISDINIIDPLLVAVSRSSGDIVLLDAATLSEKSRIHVGDGPHDIASSADGRIAIAPLHGVFPVPHDEPISPSQLKWKSKKSSGYALIDLASHAVKLRDLENCPRPHGAAISAQGQTAWITCETRGEIREVNPVSGEIKRTFKTGKGVHKVMLLEKEKILAATNPDSGEAYLIDLATGEMDRFKTGSGAEGLAATPDESVVWVANSFDKTVCSINLNDKNIGSCFATGGAFPIALAVDHGNEKLWVLRNASSDLVSLSTKTGDLIDEISLPSRPLGMALNIADGLLYVTLPRRNEVIAIDAKNGKIIKTNSKVMEADDLDLIPAAAYQSPPDT